MSQKPFMSKREYAYHALRDLILSSKLVPGERLVIDDLAQELGVSAIPIREALQQLQAEGYVVVEPYVGVHVAELEAESIHELFEVMEALEVISSVGACRRMTAEDLAQLEGLLNEMDGLLDDPDAWSEANMRLHEFLCSRANAHLTSGLLRRTLDHWDRLRRFYFAEVFLDRVPSAQREHWTILQALKARDENRVETCVREHNRAGLEAYLKHLGTMT